MVPFALELLPAITVPAGSMLFSEQQPCEGFPILADGRVKVYKAFPNGRELLLYHIDLSRIAAGRPNNQVNIASSPGVALIQADGRSDLEGFNGFNRGDVGDSYPGSTDKREWNVHSNPAARTNQTAFAGFVIDRIEQLPNQVVRFRVVNRQPSVFATSVAGTTILVNGAATTRFAEVIAAGDTVALAADSLHPINEASRYRFSSWSKGGARSQAFISGATPDTVTAGFVTELRLRVAKAGTSAGALSALAA